MTSSAFADRLRQMGVAQPNPIFSPSSKAPKFTNASTGDSQVPSSSNATLNVLNSRRRLQARVDEESSDLASANSRGREFLDIGTIRKILTLRQQGEEAAKIELKLQLKPGVVAKLGPPEVLALHGNSS